MTAVELEVFLELKRQKVPLKRDVIFFAAADEEQSGTYGMEFMVKEHFDKIECEYAINEGGGLALPMEGKNIYTVQNAEKGVGWYKLTTHGTPGHGSVPKADNALVKMSKALMRLSHPQAIRKVPIVAQTMGGMASLMKFPKNIFFTQLFNPLFSDIVLNAIGSMSKDFGEMVSASLRDTISPTMINAGYKENVIPSTCTAIIDCRILPGQTHEKFMKIVKDISGVDEIELMTESCPRPTENPVDNEFYRVVKKVMPRHDPNAVVLPLMMTGATDSRFLREKGIISLGFLPFRSVIGLEEYIGTMHSMDERCPIDGLMFAYDALFDVVSTFAG